MSSIPWRLWATQIAAIVRLEVRKSLASRRAVAIYLLAAMQLLIVIGHVFLYLRGRIQCSPGSDTMAFAAIYQIFYLRGVVFFGCVVIFLNLFRGELLDKTLHLYFLAPVKREVLAAGKFLSGLVMTGGIFGGTAVISYMIMCQHLETVPNGHALMATALSHTGAYFGVTILACLGYGAVFLVLGMLFRNPIIPAITVLVWESFIVFYPPVLKKLTVVFYLESLLPVHVPFSGDGPGRLFAIPADPPSAFVAISGMLVLSAAVLALAAFRVRRMEVNYGND